jgi:epoxyqueuosine reductase
VGFSSGGDPLYQKLKDDIGQFYWTPVEIFLKTFPNSQAKPDELTVISWILPQTEATKSDNRKESVYVSERWARSSIFGEEINDNLRRNVVTKLHEAEYEALAPVLSPLWEERISEKHGFASTWSERHAAFISGLGTFGLSEGLITIKGKAMRCGSVIGRIKIPATRRPYTDHHEYCLFYTKNICGRCIARCPTGAITNEGHNKVKCENYMHPIMNEYVKAHFGFEGYGCGLCQTKVPCESKIPVPSDVDR